MKPLSFLIIIMVLLSGCTSTQDSALIIDNQYSIEEVSSVRILMKRGQILISESTDNQLRIKGTVSQPEKITITQEKGLLVLDYEESTINDLLQINLPMDLDLNIQAFDVNIELVGLKNYTNIRNTAGDISLIDFSGKTSLWAGRGDIEIQGGEGQAVVIGEHGTLSVSNFSGPVSMTTIMGQIQFQGAEYNSGDILLEVDHGSIQAEIPDKTNYQILIDSAGGEIICRGGNLERTITGCAGSTGDGSGILRIRSVSGRIKFQIMPNIGF